MSLKPSRRGRFVLVLKRYTKYAIAVTAAASWYPLVHRYFADPSKGEWLWRPQGTVVLAVMSMLISFAAVLIVSDVILGLSRLKSKIMSFWQQTRIDGDEA